MIAVIASIVFIGTTVGVSLVLVTAHALLPYVAFVIFALPVAVFGLLLAFPLTASVLVHRFDRGAAR